MGKDVNLDISTYPTMQADELTVEQLESIYGAIPRELLDDEVIANRELYREKVVDAFLEEAIKGTEVDEEHTSIGMKK